MTWLPCSRATRLQCSDAAGADTAQRVPRALLNSTTMRTWLRLTRVLAALQAARSKASRSATRRQCASRSARSAPSPAARLRATTRALELETAQAPLRTRTGPRLGSRQAARTTRTRRCGYRCAAALYGTATRHSSYWTRVRVQGSRSVIQSLATASAEWLPWPGASHSHSECSKPCHAVNSPRSVTNQSQTRCLVYRLCLYLEGLRMLAHSGHVESVDEMASRAL
jgi:hypothetical protein